MVGYLALVFGNVNVIVAMVLMFIIFKSRLIDVDKQYKIIICYILCIGVVLVSSDLISKGINLNIILDKLNSNDIMSEKTILKLKRNRDIYINKIMYSTIIAMIMDGTVIGMIISSKRGKYRKNQKELWNLKRIFNK